MLNQKVQPLTHTTKEIEFLHKARWRQEKRKLVEEMAQDEAKE